MQLPRLRRESHDRVPGHTRSTQRHTERGQADSSDERSVGTAFALVDDGLSGRRKRRHPISQNERIRVVVADGHPGFCLALQETVKSWPEFKVCGTGGTDGDLRQVVASEDPDVVIADPGTLGLAVEELLREFEGGRPRVILIGHKPTPAQVSTAIDAGAGGLLSKDCPPREVCDTVLAVARGEPRLGASIQDAMAAAIKLREAAPGDGLTPRERDIVELIARDGMTIDQIAGELHLSRSAVKDHVAALYERFDVHKAGQLVDRLWQHGLLGG